MIDSVAYWFNEGIQRSQLLLLNGNARFLLSFPNRHSGRNVVLQAEATAVALRHICYFLEPTAFIPRLCLLLELRSRPASTFTTLSFSNFTSASTIAPGRGPNHHKDRSVTGPGGCAVPHVSRCDVTIRPASWFFKLRKHPCFSPEYQIWPQLL